jgi:hypothetical protein
LGITHHMIDSFDQFSVPRYRFPPSPHVSQNACLSVHPVGYVQRLSTPSIPVESNHPSNRRTLSIIRIQPRNVPRRFRPAQSSRYRFPPSPHASQDVLTVVRVSEPARITRRSPLRSSRKVRAAVVHPKHPRRIQSPLESPYPFNHKHSNRATYQGAEP